MSNFTNIHGIEPTLEGFQKMPDFCRFHGIFFRSLDKDTVPIHEDILAYDPFANFSVKYLILISSFAIKKKPVWLCRRIKSRIRKIQTFDLNNN